MPYKVELIRKHGAIVRDHFNIYHGPTPKIVGQIIDVNIVEGGIAKVVRARVDGIRIMHARSPSSHSIDIVNATEI
jgi:hypothetical protein